MQKYYYNKIRGVSREDKLNTESFKTGNVCFHVVFNRIPINKKKKN